MVVEDADLRAILTGPFSRGGLAPVLDLVRRTARFVPRPEAEVDPSLRQVIPYVLVHLDGAWLLARRTSRQTETRLHHRHSLGLGGHLNPDEGGEDPVTAGMRREVAEEVGLQEPITWTPVGVIYDDTDEVSRVHVGLVWVAEPAGGAFEVREPHKLSAAWVPTGGLPACRDTLEGWSKIAMDHVVAEWGRT